VKRKKYRNEFDVVEGPDGWVLYVTSTPLAKPTEDFPLGEPDHGHRDRQAVTYPMDVYELSQLAARAMSELQDALRRQRKDAAEARW
jgi:hypothetical protein